MPNVDPSHTTHWTCNHAADRDEECCQCTGHKCFNMVVTTNIEFLPPGKPTKGLKALLLKWLWK